MNAEAQHDTQAGQGRRASDAARLLMGGAVAMLLAAGLLMWWARGPAIFTDMLSAAVAWCF